MNEKFDGRQSRAFAVRCYAWSRAIHWVTVALVGGLLVSALFEDIDPHGSGNSAFLWHSSLGLVVYLLSVSRVFLWLIYRPTARKAGKPDVGVHLGLRVAFYALLVSLPLSGWWLASEEVRPEPVFGIPVLSQWYNRDGVENPGSMHSEVSREDLAQKDPMFRYLTRLHGSLGAALALVIVLHLVLVIRARTQRPSPTAAIRPPTTSRSRSGAAVR